MLKNQNNGEPNNVQVFWSKQIKGHRKNSQINPLRVSLPVARVTRRMPHVEQKLITLPQQLNPGLCGVRVPRSLVLCEMFCRSLFVLLTFFDSRLMITYLISPIFSHIGTVNFNNMYIMIHVSAETLTTGRMHTLYLLSVVKDGATQISIMTKAMYFISIFKQINGNIQRRMGNKFHFRGN